MNPRIYSFIFILFLVLTYSLCTAQDPSYSQFYANRIYLNPGFTGVQKGIRFSGIYRNQWRQVDTGFRSYGVSLEIKEPYIRSGFGIHISGDIEGIASLVTNTVGLSYAYTIPFESSELHIGTTFTFNQRRLDWEKLIFSDQLDPVFGVTQPTSAVFGLEKTNFWDANIGTVWRSDGRLKLWGQKRKTRSSVGITISHLPGLFGEGGGNISLLNQEAFTPPRLTLHGGTKVPIIIYKGTRKSFVFSPNIKLDVQGKKLNWNESLRTLTYGAFFLYEGVFLGAYFQNRSGFPQVVNTNAWILTAGTFISSGQGANYDSPNLYIGFSIDLNANGVGSNGGNIFEVAFHYNFTNAASIINKRGGVSDKQLLDCYDFF